MKSISAVICFCRAWRRCALLVHEGRARAAGRRTRATRGRSRTCCALPTPETSTRSTRISASSPTSAIFRR